MAETFIVDCIAPIPVGNRVRIRVLKEGEKGFFSRRVDAKYQVHQPWVEDLATGVEYGVYWQYSDANAIRSTPDQDFPKKLRGDLEEVRSVTGKVKACRVVTISGGEGWRAQTRLEIDVE